MKRTSVIHNHSNKEQSDKKRKYSSGTSRSQFTQASNDETIEEPGPLVDGTKDHTILLPAQEFVKLWQSGACDEAAQEKLVNILNGCELSGRMIHYFDKKQPDALSDKEWQRLAWTFGPDALSGFLGKNAREICVQLGFAEEWLIHQIAKGKKFKLSIFPSKEVDGKCATWDGLAYLLENHYSEVWPKISPHLSRIQETSFVDLKEEAGYDMWEANKAGRRQGAIDTEGESDDPNYISMQRLLVREGTCVEVRQFLWDEIGLNKLFTGKGYTEDEQGNVGPKEYLAMNKRFVDIKGLCIVDVDQNNTQVDYMYMYKRLYIK